MKRFDYRTELKKMERKDLAYRIDRLLDRVIDENMIDFNKGCTSYLTKLCYAKALFLKKFGVSYTPEELK